MPEIDLNNLKAALVKSVSDAERAVKCVIADRKPKPDEEDVTNIFQDELAKDLKGRSARNELSAALIEDIKAVVGEVEYGPLEGTFSGILAQAVWHNRYTEGRKTACDFGIVISRPTIEVTGGMVSMGEPRRRGMSVQAKKKRWDERWDGLKEPQKKMFNRFRAHGMIVAYHFIGIKDLAYFEWYSCRRRQLHTIEQWFAKDKFPTGESTETVIGNLWDDEFGSKSKKYCEQFIIPNANRVLYITVGMDEKQPPRASVYVEASRQAIEKPFQQRW